MPKAGAAPGAAGWEGEQFLMGSADFCTPRPVPGLVGFKRSLPCMLHLLTPFKPNLLACFVLHPTLLQGLAQHSRMGGEQMACSSPSHLFSLKTLSKENPGGHCSIFIKRGHPARLTLGGAVLKATTQGERSDERLR